MNVIVSVICALSVGQLSGNVAAVGSGSQFAPYQGFVERSKSSSAALGKLGQARLPCSIYSKPDIGSTVYYSVKAFQYLVVDTAKESGWVRVLLQNGQYGFVQSDSVKVMEYQVIGARPGKGSSLTKSTDLARAGDLALEKIGSTDLVDLDSGEFVQQIFGKIGVKLSADPEKQLKVGKQIDKLEKLLKGDRVYFWGDKAEKIDEVGIYLSNGYFVYLNPKSGEIGTQYLGEKKWLKRLVEARR